MYNSLLNKPKNLTSTDVVLWQSMLKEAKIKLLNQKKATDVVLWQSMLKEAKIKLLNQKKG